VQEGQEGSRSALPPAAVHRLVLGTHELRRGGHEVAPLFLGQTEKVSRHVKRALGALAVLTAFVAVVGAGAGTTRGPQLSLHWQAPTPRDGTAYAVKAGDELSFELASSGSAIRSRPLPAGVSFARAAGRATVRWTPTSKQVGEHVLTFVAQSGRSYAPPRSFIVYVLPEGPAAPHESFPLGGVNGMSRWAEVYMDVSARARPSARAKSIVRLHQYTPEGTANLVQALSGQINANGEYWVRVRLPVLPNGKTGWVPRASIGPYNEIYTHLVIDRKLFTATLYRKGKAIFRTRVGVGKPYWPTPAGEFYVRERITGFSDLIYGPLAFGTNARSSVLTDWPGGGFIGIHGTNQPEILPGRVSHGCVRMPNSAVLRLSRLMSVGTPVTIL
jgi:lipoprotein-anchoring transpeptidase ErfK/SrfK